MKKTVSILVLASLLFISCKKETTDAAPPEEVAVDGTAVATDSTAPAAVTPQQQTATGTDGNSVMYSQPSGAPSTVSAAPVATAKGMNPPHGQPGHRCDISVGAPLNSPPGKKPQTTSVSTTKVTPEMLNQASTSPPPTVSAPTTPVVTAPGMNPPHGEEGHVCGVAVGAPLPVKN